MANHNGSNVRGALLVGSIPLADAAAVFAFAGEHLGHHLKRMPDGETGKRINWTQWQLDVFNAVDGLSSELVDSGYFKRPKFCLKPGVKADEIVFPALGYASAARESYGVFRALRDQGRIPPHMKFQVCLPTPIAPTVIYVFPDDQIALEPRYEAAMAKDLEDIIGAIPAEDLAIQWDTAVEFAVIEGVFPNRFQNPEREMISRLVRLGALVPDNVELGFHLCYGSSGGRRFKDPQDMTKLVTVANGIAGGLRRRLDWLHFPVPAARDDDAFFRPISALRAAPSTELYLGLVHAEDGAEGATRRINAARHYVSDFGVATECGLGRQSPSVLPKIMAIHLEVSDALS